MTPENFSFYSEEEIQRYIKQRLSSEFLTIVEQKLNVTSVDYYDRKHFKSSIVIMTEEELEELIQKRIEEEKEKND